MSSCDKSTSASPIIAPGTKARLGPERFYLFGSGLAERYHLRWFWKHLPEQGVQLRSVMSEMLGFAIAGPKSRDLLARLCRDDLSTAAFPFRQVREMDVASAPAIVARISFTGDRGDEIYVPAQHQLAVYDALRKAGEDLGLRLFGGRALNALRLEKSFGSWTREYTPDYTAFEAGMGHFVDTKKNDFIGLEASVKQKGEPQKRSLATLVVEAGDADAFADEPVFHDGEVVGFVTSGGYGHSVGKSIALAYLPPELAKAGNGFEVEILGERVAASFSAEPLFDPRGERMRA